MKVKLSKLPDPNTISSVSMSSLHGGLNLKNEPSEVDGSQSPDMLNMWYRDGALRRRGGLKSIGAYYQTNPNTLFGATKYNPKVIYDRLFHGFVVFSTESGLFYFNPDGDEVKCVELGNLRPSWFTWPNYGSGSFIPFGEDLYYKDEYYYIKLFIDSSGSEPVIKRDYIAIYNESISYQPKYWTSSNIYLPIIAINRNPDGTGGDAYQPENCINNEKTVWFDVDDTSKDYVLPVHADSVTKIQVDDAVGADGLVGGHGYSVVNDTGKNTIVRFTEPIYIDEKFWSAKVYGASGSSGGNYLKNAVWASGDVPFKSGMDGTSATKVNGDVVSLGADGKLIDCKMQYGIYWLGWNGVTMPIRYLSSLQKDAFAQLSQFNIYDSNGNDVTEDKNAQYIMFENGAYFNMVQLPTCTYVKKAWNQIATDTFLVSYNAGTSEIKMKNYVIASYSRDTGKWEVHNYLDKDGPGGNYGSHVSYTTCNAACSDPRKPSYSNWIFGNSMVQTEVPPPIGSLRKDIVLKQDETQFYPFSVISLSVQAAYIMFNYEKEEYEKIVDMTDPEQWPAIAWVSENSDDYVFHLIPHELYNWNTDKTYMAVTGYNDDTRQFSANAHYAVSISKKDRSAYSIQDYIGGCSIGYSANNVTWSACDMKYSGYWEGFTYQGKTVAGSPLIKAGGDESYKEQYAAIGKYLARKSGATVADSDTVVVAKSENDKYIGVWIFGENSKITDVDVSTSDFKAVNWSGASYSKYLKEDITSGIDTSTPATKSNRVKITYSKADLDDNGDNKTFERIARARIGTSFGGSDAITIVLANTAAQPNAVMWSGNGSAGVDPTYFPIDQYNLSGTYQDPITALGKFNGSLIVLHENHTVRGSYSVESITNTGRKFIDIQLATINASIGCDVPNSVQLCSNNLVWANKALGLCYLNDTSWANENAIIPISGNINGNSRRGGLLNDLRSGSDTYSCDDGKRYYIIANDTMWVWDYSIASVSDGVSGLSFSRHSSSVFCNVENKKWRLPFCYVGEKFLMPIDVREIDTKGGSGRMTHNIYMFEMSEDYESDIDHLESYDVTSKIQCHYTSPTLTFDGYYRLRDVKKLLLGVRSKTGCYFTVRYCAERTSNLEREAEATMLNSHRIEIESDANRNFATPIVLTPRALHIHHFNFKIEDDGNGDIALENAVVTYTSGGVTK